ncbi:MAG TPA: hypothetical protein VHS97_06885, partial [Isosphaeraceae bacterium]|nr:hypothetical protein [Isosphaeraceae bacterium]
MLLIALASTLISLSPDYSAAGQEAAATAPTSPKPARPRVKSLEVVILSTMLTDRAGIGEWGFSALVVADGRRLLFDTGARPETVLR